MGHFIPMFFIKSLLDIIAPIECLDCQTNNTWLCFECQQKLKILTPLIIKNYDELVKEIYCCFDYKNKIVQKLIHTGKYDGIQSTIEILSGFLNNVFLKDFVQTEAVIIPVPLHPQRQRERGFNQSQIIAFQLARYLNLPIIDCQRLVNTPHQVGLNGQQRQKNMQNVFSITQTNYLSTKTAIIVDDVITTGATIKSLAKTLCPVFKNIKAVAIAKE